MRSDKVRSIPGFLLTIVLASLSAAQSAEVPVVIRIADMTGAPVPNAKVRIVPEPSPAAPAVDAQGRMTLEMKPGEYALFVQSPGFHRVVTHFEVSGGKEVQTVPVVLQVESGTGPTVVSTAGKDSLALIAYPYHDPIDVGAAELQRMPHITVSVHNPHTNSDETYAGVRLAELLGKMGAPLGGELHGEALASYVVATGSDGYAAVLALGEVDPSFHPGEVLVADTMNGKPLDAHSGPFKLVVTEDRRPARAVRNLVTIELRAAQ